MSDTKAFSVKKTDALLTVHVRVDGDSVNFTEVYMVGTW